MLTAVLFSFAYFINALGPVSLQFILLPYYNNATSLGITCAYVTAS